VRRILVIALIVGAALLSTAGTSQAAARWPARCSNFKCVNAHLNALHSYDLTVKKQLANLSWVNRCINTSFPVTQYPSYLYDDGFGGYFDTSGLDYTGSGDSIDYWVLANIPGTCGSSVFNRHVSTRMTIGGRSFRVAPPSPSRH